MVKVGQFTSNSITLNVRAPLGCVLSPLLYSLYTHDCVSSHSSTSIIKFADDTVVLGLISNNDETAYLDEVERLTSWCQDNCLSLNVSKTKELIVDFRKRHLRPYTPLMISGTPVERVSSFKNLGVNISEDLTWTTRIQTQVKKARQRLYHLRKFRVSPTTLKTFYSGTIESVLTQCISVWYGNSSSQDCKALQRVVRLVGVGAIPVWTWLPVLCCAMIWILLYRGYRYIFMDFIGWTDKHFFPRGRYCVIRERERERERERLDRT